MHYSRRISWNRGLEKSPLLHILQHTNNKKRNIKELLVVADVFRLLCICVFSNRCVLFHCLHSFIFPTYAQEFSLRDFFSFYMRMQYLILNYEHYGQTTSLFILLSFYLLTDNDSEYNNLQNNKHNNITVDGSVKMVIDVVSFIIFPFIYA